MMRPYTRANTARQTEEDGTGINQRPETSTNRNGPSGSSGDVGSGTRNHLEKLDIESYHEGEDIVAWLCKYERVAKNAGWDQRKMAARLSSHIDYTTYDWLVCLDGTDPMEGKPWGEQETLLIKQFKPVDYAWDQRRKAVRSMGTKEDIVDYYKDKMRVCRGLNIPDDNIVTMILGGIPEALYRMISKSDVACLDSPTRLLDELRKVKPE